MIQRAVKPESLDMTIGEYLSISIPKYFKLEEGAVSPICESTKIVLNGIEVDLCTCLYWLVLNMCSVDNFLYLSLIISA